MTLSEVVVASLVVGISSQISLQGWSASTRAVDAGERLQTALLRSDQRLLATRRLLRLADPTKLLLADGSCRLDPGAVPAVIAPALPRDPQIQEQWVAEATGAGLWLELSLPSPDGVPSLQRRQLFTAADMAETPVQVLRQKG